MVSGAIALAIAGLLSSGEAHASIPAVDLVAARAAALSNAKAEADAKAAAVAVQAVDKQRELDAKAVVATTAAVTTQAAVVTSSPVANMEPPKPVEIWRISAEDGTLADALRKWVEKAGYRGLEWNAPREIRAYPLEQTGTFKEALWQVMYDTGTTGFRLRSCIYKNGIVRVVPKNIICRPQ
jgi:hypothetical protein